MGINETYEKAVDVLRMNITKYGFTASPEKVDNYYSIWSRDHSICSIASILTGDKELINISKKGILRMLRHQEYNGQVPSYIEVENRRVEYGGFGIITSVDSNMWVLIASAVLYKKTGDKRFISDRNIKRYIKLYRLLRAFDSNNCGLIEVPKAGDWADVFNRTYHVLYDECLYYESLKALHFLFKEGSKRTKDESLSKKLTKRLKWTMKRRTKAKRRINNYLWFTKDNINNIFKEYMIISKIDEKEYGYYQSHLIPFKIYWQSRFETFGNILSIITNIANKKKKNKIIRHIYDNKINKPYPIKAMSPAVFKNNVGWEPIYAIKEKPHTYHNGGIWTVIAGFYIHAITKTSYSKRASAELKNLSDLIDKHGYSFNEHHHGKTAKPLGRKHQGWSGAGYVIAYKSVQSQINLFDF